MCPPIKRVHKKSATEILRKYGDINNIPIDLEEIVQKVGISVLPMDFSSLEKKIEKEHILGLVVTDAKNAVIYYKEDMPYNQQRFTIAHELGHISQHLEPDTCDYPFIDWRIENVDNSHEQIADWFALELLIPFKKLQEEYLKMDAPNSVDLASIFEVPVEAMEKYLIRRGIYFYNSKGIAVREG